MQTENHQNISSTAGGRRRTRQITLLVTLIAATAAIAHGMDQRPAAAIAPSPLPGPSPRIEVAFVLDTTGSMSGLIEGAKQKIWSIVNQMADGTPRPEIRVGLIGYRDRGDEYVTKRFDLSGDIDSIYGRLVAFQAGGGGDTPESVNQALHEAVQDLSWSDSQNAYKVIFLVGDAPPHSDYQDDISFRRSVETAREKGIAVNAIQCGNMAATTAVWKQIARIGLGEYAAISQDGGMLALETPMDAELAELNRALGKTALAYGSAAQQHEMRHKLKAAAAAPSAVASARRSYLDKAGAGLVSGMRDLVEALDEGLDLASTPTAALPEPMRAMAPEERETFVEKKRTLRRELRDEIAALTQQRDDYVVRELAQRRASGKAGGFDEKVLGAIRSQAEAAGIAYK